MHKIYIFTDGSSLGNPGPGGWGVVMKYKDSYKELSGGIEHSTNNRMELTAVIEALEALKSTKFDVVITTDSKYVTDAINKKWLFGWASKKNFGNKANEDLWRRFLLVYYNFKTEFVWVKGHNGHIENERCDELATTQSKKYKLMLTK